MKKWLWWACTYIDGRLLLVAGEDPDLDPGGLEVGDGLGHAVLQLVLDGCRA